MSRKMKKYDLEEFRTTLILLSILLAIMSLVAFMPLRNNKHVDNAAVAGYAK